MMIEKHLPVPEQLFRCEVRELIRKYFELKAQKRPLRDPKDEVARVVLGIEKSRGSVAADRLRAAINQQIKLGNKGKHGDWRKNGQTSTK